MSDYRMPRDNETRTLNGSEALFVVEQQKQRILWEGMRRALLVMVDAIERYLGISPRTAELRKQTE